MLDRSYRQMVENSPDLICLLAKGVVRYINPAGMKILDCLAQEVIGRPFTDFASCAHRSRLERLLVTPENNKRRAIMDVIRGTSADDAKVTTVDLSVVPFSKAGRGERHGETAKDGIGGVDGMVVARAVGTVKHAGRADEERYELALLATNEVIWDWYISPDCLYVSPHARDVLGIDPDAVGKESSWYTMIHSEDKAAYRQALHAHVRGETDYFSCTYRIVGRWVHQRGLRVRDGSGQVYRIAGSLEDITTRRENEDNLIVAKEKAEQASVAKTKFLATMSHELRTSLNAIIGFSEMIQSEILGAVQPTQYRSYAQTILDSGHHMLDVLTDILDVSRIEAGEMTLYPEDVDVRAVAESTVQLLSVRAAAAGVHLTAEVRPDVPPLWGEPRRLKQILLNLLGNAIKFTPEGGTVALNAVFDAPTEAIRVTVRDTGVGMRREDIPRALTPFQRIDTHRVEGTGLGLPLTNALVRLHGGTLSISSEPDKGTLVTVTFPQKRRPGGRNLDRKAGFALNRNSSQNTVS